MFLFYIGGHKRSIKRGIPNVMMNVNNRAKKIDSRLLPSTDVAIQQYAAVTSGTISEPCSFGTDPLETFSDKKAIRYQSFSSHYSFQTLFFEVSNGCGSSFCSALKYLIDVTYRLAHSS